jgi:moderate conductance mechanosensitive channel
MELDDLSRWARGDGLEIVLVVTGAVLVARAVRWTAQRLAKRLQDQLADAQAEGLVELDADQPKYAYALVQALSWLAVVMIASVATVLVLVRCNVPLTGALPPVAVVAAALGLGGSRIVADLLSGFFMLAERQYGIGDVIRISPPGTEGGVDGTVEALTLRITRLRTPDGDQVIVPNGEIRQVTNRSKGWSRVVVDVPVPLDRDIDDATTTIRRVCEELVADPRYQRALLDAPSVLGAVGLGRDDVTVRVVARTVPSRRGAVERELRLRLAAALAVPAMVAPLGDDPDQHDRPDESEGHPS